MFNLQLNKMVINRKKISNTDKTNDKNKTKKHKN